MYLPNIKHTLYCLYAVTVFGCTPQEKKEKTLSEYDLQSPDKFFMPESIFEISGITFNKGESDTVYAIQDEEGKLFKLALGVKKQVHTKFGKKGDYEDLAIVKNQVFILKSTGALVSFPLAAASEDEVDGAKEWKHIAPKGEYESIYGDEESGKLYLLCKNCAQDDPKNRVSGFIFTYNDSLSTAGDFHIDVAQIKDKGVKMKTGFKPSGLAQNPITKDWYIISAINKLLVVTDSNWKVKETSHLDAEKFVQPEGIVFDKSGTMYISNEGSDISEGNILKFGRIVK